jgi:hypothetical protein
MVVTRLSSPKTWPEMPGTAPNCDPSRWGTVGLVAKRLYRTAQGLSPGLSVARKSALKASPARYAGAIRTKRNTSILPTPSLRLPGFDDEYEAPHEWRPRQVF